MERVGRFAPSPTGPLHAGSLVAALASWLDARAQGGRWLVRIEDVDTERCVQGVDTDILSQLHACGLVADGPVVWQSQRTALYQAALERLIAQQLAYSCNCSRGDIAAALGANGVVRQRHAELRYPGTCRVKVSSPSGPFAWRFRTERPCGPQALVAWQDRRLGPKQQDVATEVGDFVLRRRDGLWAYQLAVVVDDAEQGVTDVVRGADLCDNTARQIMLARALGLPIPSYLHTPLVLAANGEKLSKQNSAAPLDLRDPLAALQVAAAVLGLPAQGSTVAEALVAWVRQWSDSYNRSGEPSP